MAEKSGGKKVASKASSLELGTIEMMAVTTAGEMGDEMGDRKAEKLGKLLAAVKDFAMVALEAEEKAE